MLFCFGSLISMPPVVVRALIDCGRSDKRITSVAEDVVHIHLWVIILALAIIRDSWAGGCDHLEQGSRLCGLKCQARNSIGQRNHCPISIISSLTPWLVLLYHHSSVQLSMESVRVEAPEHLLIRIRHFQRSNQLIIDQVLYTYINISYACPPLDR